jgi:putative endonuclease
MSKTYSVYIMASGRNGTLYIGVTNDVGRRSWEHHEGLAEGFTKKYGVRQLVWHQTHLNIHDAIRRETLLKKWKRRWKLELIEKTNPDWHDLRLTLNN